MRDSTDSSSEEVLYTRDVFSEKDELDIETQIYNGLKYFKSIAQLPSNATLKLGVGKDAICNDCVIGDHCVRRNGTRYGGEKDTIVGEVRSYQTLVKIYQDAGLIEEEDYILGIEKTLVTEDDETTSLVDTPYIVMTINALQKVFLWQDAQLSR